MFLLDKRWLVQSKGETRLSGSAGRNGGRGGKWCVLGWGDCISIQCKGGCVRDHTEGMTTRDCGRTPAVRQGRQRSTLKQTCLAIALSNGNGQ